MATEKHLTWTCGETATIHTEIIDENITGWALEAYLSVAYEGTDVLVTKTVGDGITITDGANGLCTIIFDGDDTKNLNIQSLRVYQWALWRTDVGYEKAYITGDVILTGSARIISS